MRIKPADNFEDAYNALAMDRELLEDRSIYEAYYVLRENSPINELKHEILMDRSYSKILFTGHRKSGKSTELYRLVYELEDRLFIVFTSIFDELEISDIEYVDILLMIALKLSSKAMEEGIHFDEDLIEELYRWLSQISSEVTLVRVEEKSKKKGIGTKLKMLIAELGLDFQTNSTSRLEVREKLKPRTSEVIEKINIIAQTIQSSLGKEPLVIIDDLDKIDPEVAEKIFYGHVKSLTRPNCKILFTVPISLIYTGKFTQIERDFPICKILPAIKIKNKDGSDNEEGLNFLREIILRRMSEDLFEEDALNHLLRISNGVLSDLLSVARTCCAKAVASKKNKITWEMVDEEFEKLVNSYRRTVDRKYYPVLKEIMKSKTADMDENVRNLLGMLAVIDYGGYYYLHPAVERLLKERGR